MLVKLVCQFACEQSYMLATSLVPEAECRALLTLGFKRSDDMSCQWGSVRRTGTIQIRGGSPESPKFKVHRITPTVEQQG